MTGPPKKTIPFKHRSPQCLGSHRIPMNPLNPLGIEYRVFWASRAMRIWTLPWRLSQAPTWNKTADFRPHLISEVRWSWRSCSRSLKRETIFIDGIIPYHCSNMICVRFLYGGCWCVYVSLICIGIFVYMHIIYIFLFEYMWWPIGHPPQKTNKTMFQTQDSVKLMEFFLDVPLEVRIIA